MNKKIDCSECVVRRYCGASKKFSWIWIRWEALIEDCPLVKLVKRS